jgi:hypothetical protein
MMEALADLRPAQAMAASLFFRHKKLMLMLPRQFGGKTELGVRLAHDLCRRPAPSSSMFVAKSTGARKKATREKFLRLFDRRDFEVNTELIYLKKSPMSQIFMASIDKDPGNQRGGSLVYLHCSEMAFWKMDLGMSVPDCWQGVLAPMINEIEGYALLESTPNGSNGWRDLWDNAKFFGFKTFKLSLGQMVELGLVPEETYQRIKSEMHPLMFDQEYELDWVTFQGLVYNEFDEHTHVADIAPPEDWQACALAIDWGFDPSATCILMAYQKDGVICVFDEIYALRQRLEETQQSIEARQLMWRIARFAAVGDHEEDRNEELTRGGIPVTKADKVNVLGNRLQIKTRLYQKKILIHPRCQYLIKDLKSATWHEKKEGDLDYSKCSWGHYDAEAALRYLIRAFDGYEECPPVVNPHIGINDAAARAWDMQRRALLDDEEAA